MKQSGAQKNLIGLLCQLEIALGGTVAIADGFVVQVSREKAKLDDVSVQLLMLQSALGQAQVVAGEVRTKLEA